MNCSTFSLYQRVLFTRNCLTRLDFKFLSGFNICLKHIQNGVLQLSDRNGEVFFHRSRLQVTILLIVKLNQIISIPPNKKKTFWIRIRARRHFYSSLFICSEVTCIMTRKKSLPSYNIFMQPRAFAPLPYTNLAGHGAPPYSLRTQLRQHTYIHFSPPEK